LNTNARWAPKKRLLLKKGVASSLFPLKKKLLWLPDLLARDTIQLKRYFFVTMVFPQHAKKLEIKKNN